MRERGELVSDGVNFSFSLWNEIVRIICRHRSSEIAAEYFPIRRRLDTCVRTRNDHPNTMQKTLTRLLLLPLLPTFGAQSKFNVSLYLLCTHTRTRTHANPHADGDLITIPSLSLTLSSSHKHSHSLAHALLSFSVCHWNAVMNVCVVERAGMKTKERWPGHRTLLLHNSIQQPQQHQQQHHSLSLSVISRFLNTCTTQHSHSPLCLHTHAHTHFTQS